jgi:hypothetical protein
MGLTIYSTEKNVVCLYIGFVAGRAGQVGLRGMYAAVVTVDTVTNTVTNIVGINTRWM